MAYRMIPETRMRQFQRRIRKDAADGCWNWTGPMTWNGYGITRFKGKNTTAHRAFWRFMRGEIPDGMDLDHLCRNRLCVNTDHLEQVTRSENLRRGFESRGCVNGHPYKPEDFSIVRRSDGSTERRCKVCHRERNGRAKRRLRLG